MKNTRERIINAAMNLFSEKGYIMASIDEIASKACVSKGLVFWYFRSKKELIREVALKILPRSLLDGCADRHRGRELIDCIVDGFLKKYSDPRMRRLLLFTFSYQALDEEIDKEISSMCSKTIGVLARKAYGADDLERRVMIRALIGSLICYILTPHECIPAEKYGEVVKKIFYPTEQ